MVRLNPETRKPQGGTTAVIDSIAYRPKPPDALEAPFIIYKPPHYYLFASFGLCCRGVNSTYNIRVGRASRITGPYYDESGIPMINGGGTRLLSTEGPMIGPGGQSVTRVGSRYYLVYHYYDYYLDGEARVQVRRITWHNGWPELGAPMVNVPGKP